MGLVLDFEGGAVASLRRRVAEVEGANRSLLAFARGHSGAVAAIHRAVLAAMDADGLEHLVQIVTQEWPDPLGLDAVALAVRAGDAAMRADMAGLHATEPAFVDRAMDAVAGVAMRDVRRGHPLFGPAAALIRGEALVRFGDATAGPRGLLALGQRRPLGEGRRHDSEPLLFLGGMVARLLGHWLP